MDALVAPIRRASETEAQLANELRDLNRQGAKAQRASSTLGRMSAAGVLKRPRDGAENEFEPPAPREPSCSPLRMMALESPASKRTRQHAPLSQGSAPSAGARPSPFAAGPSGAGPSGAGALPLPLAASPQRCDPATGEPLFTLDQVQNIVRHAVDQKEAQLREQYDQVLQAKLQEQYASFAKFNEDYLSRQLKTNDLSYLS